jgi:hypothetical protein
MAAAEKSLLGVRCRNQNKALTKSRGHEFHSSSTPGSYSRMLDMGGVPSASTTMKNTVRLPNASKNSKVQAVVIDFELLVRTIQEQQDFTQETKTTTTTTTAKTSTVPWSASVITPNVDQIQQVAKLLKVDLNLNDDQDSSLLSKSNSRSYKDDDLSTLLGDVVDKDSPKDKKTMSPSATTTTTTSVTSNSSQDTSSSSMSMHQDIRAKYATKLHRKGVEGGVAGVELVKYQRDEALKRGDAEGHFAARAIASASGSSSSSSTRWMALTGTGKLLSTLTRRSMKIALLPRPPVVAVHNNHHHGHGQKDADVSGSDHNPWHDRSPNERMIDLTRQLKDVVFDVLVDLPPQSTTTSTTGSDSDPIIIKTMVQSALEQLALEPKVIVFVSDQDTFLKEAQELGMITCRIRPLNARRGNVSCHYTVENVLQVLDVINELAGISFNAVLNM